jgi:hypothetical protein
MLQAGEIEEFETLDGRVSGITFEACAEPSS